MAALAKRCRAAGFPLTLWHIRRPADRDSTKKYLQSKASELQRRQSSKNRRPSELKKILAVKKNPIMPKPCVCRRSSSCPNLVFARHVGPSRLPVMPEGGRRPRIRHPVYKVRAKRGIPYALASLACLLPDPGLVALRQRDRDDGWREDEPG
jgi:hypothetical protein